jgi:quinol monooxygenase YgiN
MENQNIHPSDDKQYIILVEFTFAEKNIEKALELLDEMEGLTLENEDDCLIYDVTYSEEEPTRVFIYEVYENEAAFKIHENSVYFKELVVGGIIPLAETTKITKLVELNQ